MFTFNTNKFITFSSNLVLILLIQSQIAFGDIKEVVLLHTNDIESVYEPIESVWRDDIEFMGGIPYLATLIKQTREAHDVSFLFDAGDIFTGALSKKSLGKLPFDLYSTMGYDVITLGNHEFEYGWEVLSETMYRASFPVLNANIIYEDSGRTFSRPYAIVERDGVRIGVVGVMGVDAFYNTIAKFQRTGLAIKDPTETAQYWVDKIKDDVDIVVVLTHQNKTAPMQTNKESDPSVQRGFDEDYAMAGKLKNVDVIFGGHSDNGLNNPVIHPDTGTVIGITFGQGMHLGYTKFAFNEKDKSVRFIEGRLIPVNAKDESPDKGTLKLIEKQRQQNPELTEEVAYMQNAALRQYNRESTIGNILSDIMRSQSGADIALLNSGAIRADLNSGPVTKEDLINVYPFVDKLTTVQITGKQLKQLIEYSCTLPYGIAQFSGLQIKYNPSKPKFQRVLQALWNGESINDEQLYTVATTGFVAAGGDGYEIFTKGEVVRADKWMADALQEGFKERVNVSLPPLDRQTIVSE